MLRAVAFEMFHWWSLERPFVAGSRSHLPNWDLRPPRMVQASVVKDVGRRIRQLRTSRSARMTQEDLSERARISVSFLSMIERGERSPHLETLASIAGALD